MDGGVAKTDCSSTEVAISTPFASRISPRSAGICWFWASWSSAMATSRSRSKTCHQTRRVILSPPKSRLILPGITYDVVAELAAANAMPIEFRAIPEREVRSADEIWVTSSSKEVLAIVELDGKAVGDGRPGPVFKRMFQLYQEFKRKVMRAGKREVASV